MNDTACRVQLHGSKERLTLLHRVYTVGSAATVRRETIVAIVDEAECAILVASVSQ